jgi:hypothetical protein
MQSPLAQQTSLHEAAKAGNEQLIWQLLQSGINPSIRDGYQRTALHWAAELNHLGVARLLIQRGVNIEAQGGVGWTALHCAVNEGHLQMAQLLLEAGAQVDSREYKGNTPLYYAAMKRHQGVAQLLVARGANRQALTMASMPMQQQQFNPFQMQAPSFMPMPMHMPNYGGFNLHHGVAHHNPAAGIGFGPNGSLGNQWNMQQNIAFAGDQTLVAAVPAVNVYQDMNSATADFASS